MRKIRRGALLGPIMVVALAAGGCALVSAPEPESAKATLTKVPADLPHRRPGSITLLVLPPEAKPGGTVTLQSIGRPRESGKPEAEARITDGDVSPNGAWVALRSKTAIFFHRTADLMAGNWTPAGRVSLKALGEPQGEGLAFGDDTTLYLVGEGGGKSRPGTFGRVTCAF